MNEEDKAHWRLNVDNELEQTIFMNGNQSWSRLKMYSLDKENSGYL